jgi:hypothetical protein
VVVLAEVRAILVPYETELLSSNVRGLNEGDKCLRVRNLLRDWKIDGICLHVTKVGAYI